MMTTRRLVATVVAMTVLIALLSQMVIMQRGYVHEIYEIPQSDGRTWFEWFDWYSVRLARRIVEDKTFFETLALLGLRGLILSVCVPILAYVAWRRRTWVPIVGFVIVLLFETGLAGSMKVAMGRQFPWESWPRMGELQSGELAFPSGHATNVVALLGYMAWYFTKAGTFLRKIAWGLVATVSVVVSVSSWLIRTHWPTDLVAGSAYGVIALVTVIALFQAAGLNPSATAQHSPTTRP